MISSELLCPFTFCKILSFLSSYLDFLPTGILIILLKIYFVQAVFFLDIDNLITFYENLMKEIFTVPILKEGNLPTDTQIAHGGERESDCRSPVQSPRSHCCRKHDGQDLLWLPFCGLLSAWRAVSTLTICLSP